MPDQPEPATPARRKAVPVTGLWLRRERDELVALIEVRDEWREVVRVAIDGDWQLSHVVESSGLFRFVSENYAKLQEAPDA